MVNEDQYGNQINNLKEIKMINIAIHLLGLFTGFIGPLIFYLIATTNETKEHAKKVLNWQFSFLIYTVINFIITYISFFIYFIGTSKFAIITVIGYLIIIVLSILNIIFNIKGAIKANNNILWDYPLSIKFFK